ncbi:MAG: hypothetical protein ACHQIO_21475, partial [Nevskiales bacterium]
MPTPLETYLQQNPELADVPRDDLLRQLHGAQFPDMPYEDFVARASGAAPAVDYKAPDPAADLSRAGIPVMVPAGTGTPKNPQEQLYREMQRESGQYGAEQRGIAEEKKRQDRLVSGYTPFVDPNTGLSPDDVTPEGADRFARAVARSALEGTSHLVGALSQRNEAYQALAGDDTLKQERKRWQQGLRGAVPPAAPSDDPRDKAAELVGGVIGGLPTGIAEWAGGPGLAMASGAETAEEVAAGKGEQASTWQRWRDAGTEGILRVMLGRAAAMPWGRTTTGLVFGAGSGFQSLVEGKGREDASIQAITSFLLGVLGKNITPGA